MSINREESVVVVEDAHLKVSPLFLLLELASDKFPLTLLMSALRSWKDVRKRRYWRIRSQSRMKLLALLLM